MRKCKLESWKDRHPHRGWREKLADIDSPDIKGNHPEMQAALACVVSMMMFMAMLYLFAVFMLSI